MREPERERERERKRVGTEKQERNLKRPPMGEPPRGRAGDDHKKEKKIDDDDNDNDNDDDDDDDDADDDGHSPKHLSYEATDS